MKLDNEVVPGERFSSPIEAELGERAIKSMLAQEVVERCAIHLIDWTPEVLGRLITIGTRPTIKEQAILELADSEHWMNAAKTVLNASGVTGSFDQLDQFILASLQP